MNVEMLRQLLDYDPETGCLTWRARTASMFASESHAGAWNARFSGSPALNSGNGDGYLGGRIFGRKYKAHRVAWALYHGEWPCAQIDHKNGVRDDNRIKNLRDVTAEVNNKNKAAQSNNTSGSTGVYWHKQNGKWTARVKDSGRVKNLGYFSDFGDAVSARKAAERELGYSQNHGRTK